MIEIQNIEVWGFKHGVRGMRNPLNSWEKSDSLFDSNSFKIGEKDLNLMKQLCQAGPEHRKFARQIMVSMDIIAPLYFWNQFDTYKIGTVSNSCSKMHTIHKKPFEYKDFSFDHIQDTLIIDYIIKTLNESRINFIETKDKRFWWEIIQLLPESYNQKRTITINYENIFTFIKQRKNHKLDEWNDFIKILKKLPYVKEFLR